MGHANRHTIFLTHAHEDGQLARLIMDQLLLYGGPQLDVFSSSEIPAGTDWTAWITERLLTTDLFILLLTEASSSFDWHLYELGLYLGPHTEDKRAAVCIHQSGMEPPAPLKTLQVLPADQRHVGRFLRTLFGSTDLLGDTPLNEHFAHDEEELSRAAERISNAFPAPRRSYDFAATVRLKAIRADRDAAALDERSIVVLNELAARAFGVVAGEQTWGDLTRERKGEPWIAALERAVHRAATGRRVQPITDLLQTEDRFFRLLIHRIDDLGHYLDGRVLLIEEVPTESVFGQPKPSGSWPDLFMLMPFTEQMSPVFSDHVKEVASRVGLSAARADDFFSVGSVVEDIWSAVYHSKVIVADCTGRNPNVFYEVGMAHTLGKDSILISQSIDDVPFDLRHLRVIHYEYTPRGMSTFEQKLEETLWAILPKEGS